MIPSHSAPRAVCLLSGGLDSATCLAWAVKAGFECHALSFDYGQRHRFELQCAVMVARSLGAVQHRTATIDLRAFGGSALTAEIDVPKDRVPEDLEEEIPITYVPARNTIFLSFGLAWAEVLGASDIVIGVNAVDYSGYPDCRPEFIAAYEKMANLATRAGVETKLRLKIHTPLIELSKAGIIQLGHSLGVDFSQTSSCYDPLDTVACGHCDACVLRLRGFADAGLSDPLPYSR